MCKIIDTLPFRNIYITTCRPSGTKNDKKTAMTGLTAVSKINLFTIFFQKMDRKADSQTSIDVLFQLPTKVYV